MICPPDKNLLTFAVAENGPRLFRVDTARLITVHAAPRRVGPRSALVHDAAHRDLVALLVGRARSEVVGTAPVVSQGLEVGRTSGSDGSIAGSQELPSRLPVQGITRLVIGLATPQVDGLCSRALVHDAIDLGELASLVCGAGGPRLGTSRASPGGVGGLGGGRRGRHCLGPGAGALVRPGTSRVDAGRVVGGAVREGGLTSGGTLEILRFRRSGLGSIAGRGGLGDGGRDVGAAGVRPAGPPSGVTAGSAHGGGGGGEGRQSKGSEHHS
jgi:hypothetical protein